jgi:orotidine-5'-phosphate decarboxylase
MFVVRCPLSVDNELVNPVQGCRFQFRCPTAWIHDFSVNLAIQLTTDHGLFLCDMEGSCMKSSKDYIVFPLDVSTAAEARKYVELLRDDVGMFKVGLELFVRSGPEIVKMIQACGPAGIFLDLKLHDIPATVAGAMRAISEMGDQQVTVHCGEAPEMLRAAVAAAGGSVGVLGVTVLTSVSPEDIRAAGFGQEYSNNLSALVMKRAAMTRAAGCAGIVCSGLEVKSVKAMFGRDFIAVTPGIRPAWDASGKDDQKRITTPARAVQDGADFLVIGRPIRNAKDPRAAARRIAGEINEVKG